jgi:hypothetical protein
MYVNAKMILVETVTGTRGGGIKESSGGVNSNVIYLVHCKNFCKCQCTTTQHNNKEKKIKYH